VLCQRIVDGFPYRHSAQLNSENNFEQRRKKSWKIVSVNGGFEMTTQRMKAIWIIIASQQWHGI